MATEVTPTGQNDDPVGQINKYDFRTPSHEVFKARRGLDREIVLQISEMKGEPEWMRDFRLKSLELFESKTGEFFLVEVKKRGEEKKTPPWPETIRLELKKGGKTACCMYVNLGKIQPCNLPRSNFFVPAKNMNKKPSLYPPGFYPGRITIKGMKARRAVLMEDPGSELKRLLLLATISRELKKAGIKEIDYPVFFKKKSKWMIALPFTARKKPPQGFESIVFEPGLYAELFVQGPLDENLLMHAFQLDTFLAKRNLVPAGPLEFVPLKRLGGIILPHERDEQWALVRVKVLKK